MARTASGRTERASGVILGAKFWTAGLRIRGIFVRSFTTALDGDAGECFQFLCVEPQLIEVKTTNGKFDADHGTPEKVDRFSIGMLAGVDMALQDIQTSNQWFQKFQYGDRVTIECTGVQKATQANHSDMPTFQIDVER